METLAPDSVCPAPKFAVNELEMASCVEDSFDSALCVSGPRLIRSGFEEQDCKDDFLMFINAGGHEIQAEVPNLSFVGDSFFQDGDVIGTNETIIGGGAYPFLYQSARFGNFSYKFDGLSSGEYFVDLHFAEIVNTNGPKGIRVFDVFVQDEKVLSEFDIYAIVGANKPIQLVDVRVFVEGTDALTIKFEERSGTPMVCGICIRRAPNLTASMMTSEHLMCNKCAHDIEVYPAQKRARSMKLIAKYEKKIQELTNQCKSKSDECYQAWLSLSAANEELEKLKMEHDTKLFQAEALEQIIEQQTEKLKETSYHYLHDKKMWASALRELEGKIKVMKQEQFQLSQEAHECANSIPNMNKMIDGVQALVAQYEDLKMKYSEELTKSKKLYNQVQESKGNIRVFCRCRPLSKEEVASGYMTIVDFEAAKDGDLGIISGGSTKKSFKFDRIFTPNDNQADVYADASPVVTSVLDGYNVCIFAYGQTGTGKTFTMEGTEHSRGVNYRTLEELFKIAGERKETFCYSISVSVLEVYNEQIRDLLATSPSSKKLEIRQAAEGFHNVPGIVEANVENIKEVWDVLQAGSNARAVGSNNINEHSSRSHCMLCIMVRAKNLMNGECTSSKLWLVDLAGSERLAKTDAQGERLKEAQNINRSLSALGDVISSLASKNSHIPYRNSKLTHLLQDSLGGDSKALMFVQISPSENDLGETMSSLNFASRVRGVELGLARKQIDTGELQKTKQMLDKVRHEMRIKDESLRKLEENCQTLENKTRAKEQQCRSLQEKNKELEGQHWQLSDKLKGKEEVFIALQQKVKELELKLKENQHSESMVLQQKVRELECRLKDQMHSESIACQKARELECRLNDQTRSESMAAEKVKELEFKLKERAQFESMLEQKVKELEFELNERAQIESMLEQKVKELEQRLREERDQQQRDSVLSLNSIDAFRIATPLDGRASRDEFASENYDPQILRSSDSINKHVAGHHSSALLKGTVSLNEIKRKREVENGGMSLQTTSVGKKMAVPCELSRVRRIDPAKALGRITRVPKGGASQRTSTQGGAKEKERMRGWVR